MSTTVTYKGSTLTTVENATKTLVTSGKYMEGDVIITDVTSGGGGTTKVDFLTGVVFIDYDGTIVEYWSAEDVANKGALPANPSHSGLVAQGWNWTLANIKLQIQAHPETRLVVGQMYITASGNTEIDIDLSEGRTEPYLGIAVKGTVTVDWGDNTSDSITGTSLTTQIRTPHSYLTAGEYTITITVNSGEFAFFGTNVYFIMSKNSSNPMANRVYSCAVKSVRIGNNASIGAYGLYGTNIKSASLPSGINVFGVCAFSQCVRLNSVVIPDGATYLGANCFDGCNSLKLVAMPQSVITIKGSAFKGCRSLDTVFLPNLSLLNDYLFSECASLKSISIPQTVTKLSRYAFYRCYALSSISIPQSVTAFGDYVFAGCSALESLTIPQSVTTLGSSSSFDSCTALREINIPDGILTVGQGLFAGCRALSKIIVPDSVTFIGSSAFSNCYGMAEYHILPTTPPRLGSGAFSNIQSECKIYVPLASLADYQAATNWSTYASQMVGE